MPDQPALFELPPASLPAAPARDEDRELAARLPRTTRLGTMSWAYPGWANLVYDGAFSKKTLSEHGLTAYAQHPLLRSVEIDRSYYEPLSAATYHAYAAQTPADFRFVVKAHLECTTYRHPDRPHAGAKAGQRNVHYLDPAYATEHVVRPLLEGLGERAFALLFQFPPQQLDERPTELAKRLQRFLIALPPAPFAYAVELRNRELFTPAYGEALVATGAIHCHNVWPDVPSLLAQVKALPPATRRPLLVRWLMPQGDDYDASMARSQPFHRLVRPDPVNLAAVARLVRSAQLHEVPALVAIDNRAEGCAPATATRLARSILEARPPAEPVPAR